MCSRMWGLVPFIWALLLARDPRLTGGITESGFCNVSVNGVE